MRARLYRLVSPYISSARFLSAEHRLATEVILKKRRVQFFQFSKKAVYLCRALIRSGPEFRTPLKKIRQIEARNPQELDQHK